jgi:uncharacterized protein YgfB (UPF0149 family)
LTPKHANKFIFSPQQTANDGVIGAITKSLGIDPAQITDMMSGMLGGAGGANKELLSMVTGMMGGGGDEQDLLKLLENAKPDMMLPPQKKKKSGKKHRGKK